MKLDESAPDKSVEALRPMMEEASKGFRRRSVPAPTPIAWTMYARRATHLPVRHLTAGMNFALVCALATKTTLHNCSTS